MTRRKKFLAALVLLLAALVGLAAWHTKPKPVPLPTPSVGTVERLESFPSRFVPPRHVDIWLPPGYSTERRYAVLYMQDGQMLFDPAITWNRQEWRADEVSAALMAEGRVQPFIIVAVHNGGRDRGIEYLPQKPLESLPAEKRASLARWEQVASRRLAPESPRADAYLRFLVEELKPYVDRHYPVHTDAAHTAIMGSSMGGLISLYAIAEYPQVFGAAACVSTHWPGTMDADEREFPEALFSYMRERLPDPATHRIYFDYGTATIDAAYGPLQAQADVVMAGKGYSASNWQTLRFEGAEHSENAWAARLDRPLVFLFGTPPAAAATPSG